LPVEVYVHPGEWLYIQPLIVLANHLRRRGVKPNPRETSRHEVTKYLQPLEDFVQDRMGRTATISRIMDIVERSVGFGSEEEREEVSRAVVRLVDEVAKYRSRAPESIFDFLRALRYALLGIFYGYISPKLYERCEERG
jgi:hypothetical protein